MDLILSFLVGLAGTGGCLLYLGRIVIGIAILPKEIAASASLGLLGFLGFFAFCKFQEV
jgi:hypothetical protein